MNKRFDHLEQLIDGLADTTAKSFGAVNERFDTVDQQLERMATKEELSTGLDSVREELGGKIDGVQRAVDAAFERHSALEARVTKVETELHM